MRGDRHNGFAMRDMRRDRRHPLPVLEIAIGNERFRSINWSMHGALLDGICDLIGARVRGVMGLARSREPIPFTATVIRADFATGNCAICFEDWRTEQIDFTNPKFADQLH